MSEKSQSPDSLSFFTTLYYIEDLADSSVVAITRETESYIYGVIVNAKAKKRIGKGFVSLKQDIQNLYNDGKIDFYKNFRDRTGFSL